MDATKPKSFGEQVIELENMVRMIATAARKKYAYASEQEVQRKIAEFRQTAYHMLETAWVKGFEEGRGQAFAWAEGFGLTQPSDSETTIPAKNTETAIASLIGRVSILEQAIYDIAIDIDKSKRYG